MTNNNPSKARNSGFELLRIVAMLMIITGHIVVHCVKVQLTDQSSMARLNNGLFNLPVFSKKLWILNAITPFGSIGNTVFILISGYFLVSKRGKIQIGQIAKKLLSQQGFAAIMLVISSTFIYLCTNPANGSKQYISLLPISVFNYMSWFTGYYFTVILAAFLFLNKFLNELDRSQYKTFLIVIFAFFQFSFSRDLASSLVSCLATTLSGIFLYSLGGYLKRYNPFANIKSWVFILLIILIYALILLSCYNTTTLNIENFERNWHEGDQFIQSVVIYDDYSIVVILIGISLFELFTRVQIPQNNIINFLGSATFMVYLIHDNGLFYSLWDTIDWITLLFNRPFLFVTKLSQWTFITFTIGILAYCIYLLIGKAFTNNKHFFLKQ